MFVYDTGSGYAMCASPLNKEYGLKKDNGNLYTKKELLKFGFFIDDIPDKPQSAQYEYVMKVDFDAEMVYYDKIPIRSIVSEDTKVDFLTKELASSKLESMKLKGLLKQNSEEIAKAI
ncbi:TPA: hypothetical protein ACXDAY_004104 [Clostridium botulinum]|uniref:hypothetical protein n=1 Tax=Clostridium botulinum TaxID=1491 RepID=UPI00035BA209|nr:hypothetical protein [Clostridium botulinum]EPS56494.1 hypothetical protein CLQ_02211 [Clostridium botulinum Af84]MBN3351442.1 hypothetical protein [Clostridium botulinum]MBN3358720.1 hypothetical protein [Clostridium botulinum]MBN3389196.1 hypothetical protein [Clostridium botulinum]MBN3429719.1 hypothetical protein [Clostridium botulinum]